MGINYFISGGLSLALLKPVYLWVIESDGLVKYTYLRYGQAGSEFDYYFSELSIMKYGGEGSRFVQRILHIAELRKKMEPTTTHPGKEETGETENKDMPLRKPHWLKVKIGSGAEYPFVREKIEGSRLHTICQSGACPNMGECWMAGTATFMVLGNICTRSCRFCAVTTGRPLPPDPDEPRRVAESIRDMGLRHAVVTSVDRDDLSDGGAAFWAEVIRTVRKVSPGTTVEVLVPDFKGVEKDIRTVVEASPDIISHNMETVERLSRQVRVQARYDRSLEVLKTMKRLGARRTKSGIMLGLGETEDEILATLSDLRSADVDIVTIGQYLRPTKEHLPVSEYVTPEKFEFYRQQGLRMGFRIVQSAPLVRSSYHAADHVF